MRSCSVLALLLALAAPAGATPAERLAPGRVIVRWKSSPRHPQRLAGHRVRRARHLGGDAWAYHLDERSAAASLAALEALRVKRDPDILEVIPVHQRELHAAPPITNDPLLGEQWHLEAIRMLDAWAGIVDPRSTIFARDPRGVIVAVLDTGVDLQHPDLDPARLLPGYDFVSDAGSAGDHDGSDPDPDAVAGSARSFHGTHVGGIIAATPGNGLGVTGVNPHCRILPVRVMGLSGYDPAVMDDDLIAGIRWAAGLLPSVENPNRAHVINLSLGGERPNPELARAIVEVQRAGVMVVASAGNHVENNDADRVYPAAYPYVISVAAAGRDRQLAADFSALGRTVELLAPGVGITSTYRDLGFGPEDGTSQAAPQVTGVLALMLAISPGLGIIEASDILEQTADHGSMCRTSSGHSGCGGGLLDADLALAVTSGARFATSNRTRPSVEVLPETIEGGCSIAGSAGDSWLAAVLALLAVVASRRRAQRREPGRPLDGGDGSPRESCLREPTPRGR